MAEISRPSPDELLARIKSEEEQKKRGRLKIFLGYAAGVGKTYTMLEAAQQLKKDTDVVLAYVETHRRAETDALLKGLEAVPVKQVEYRGIKLPEMDIDAVLARLPRLALVDELAHDNVPGSRHPKRYMDVEELLDAGIDVYTTLNIQHIESVRNVVAQITGIWMRETVPDSIIDNAAEIELVDLPPDELIKRLKEGKVYVPAQIVNATEKFFRKGNLTALRELTMRTAARHVDEQTLAYMKTHAIQGPWFSGERLLVCVSPGSLSTRVVRSARRLAYQLGAEWFAAYVETPENSQLSPDQQDRIMDALRLAERLGAKTVTLQGGSVAAAVLEYVSANNITKVVVGNPQRRRLLRTSVADSIIRVAEDIDVYVVGGHGEAVKKEIKLNQKVLGTWRGYLLAVGLLTLTTLLGRLINQLILPTTLVMMYLICVVITAFLWGMGPSVLITALSLLVFDFFFVPPFLSLELSNRENVFAFFILLIVAVVVSYLASRVRQHNEAIRQRERQTATLYALSRDLTLSNDLDSYIHAIIRRTKETFGRDAMIFLPDVQNNGKLKVYTDTPDVTVGESELAAAAWSLEHQSVVGYGTDTLPNAGARFLPLVTARGEVGVLALSATGTGGGLTIEQERLLEAYADLVAVAVESIVSAEEARNAQFLRATEKLQTAFLSSVSHDLLTPVESLVGTLQHLQQGGTVLDDATRQSLVQFASEETETLSHLITNLIDQSRIDAGAVKVARQLHHVQDLVNAALAQLSGRRSTRQIKQDIPTGLPPVPVDFNLIVQTLVNILDNSFKYSPAGSPVEISAQRSGQEIQIQMADRGIGIPPQDLARVFDKFYRVQRPDNVMGTGLGLSIGKGFIEAHGGHIWAENRPGAGTIIKLTLPISEPGPEVGGKPVI